MPIGIRRSFDRWWETASFDLAARVLPAGNTALSLYNPRVMSWYSMAKNVHMKALSPSRYSFLNELFCLYLQHLKYYRNNTYNFLFMYFVTNHNIAETSYSARLNNLQINFIFSILYPWMFLNISLTQRMNKYRSFSVIIDKRVRKLFKRNRGCRKYTRHLYNHHVELSGPSGNFLFTSRLFLT